MRRHVKASSAGSTQRQATGLGRNRIAFACLLALLAFCGISASSALAAQSRVPESFSPLGPIVTGSGVTITAPGGLAIDEGTGNLFLNHSTNTTFILNGSDSANPPVGLVAPYSLTGLTFASLNNGAAFDNFATSPNLGALYVGVNGAKVKKFTRDALSEKYVLVQEWTPAGASFGTNGNTGVAVDTSGNVFVGQFMCSCVVKFNPSGAPVAVYNVVSSVFRPTSLAVDGNGNLFAANAANGGVFKYPVSGLPADGTPGVPTVGVPTESTEILASGATGIAIDHARSKLYIALGNRVAQYGLVPLAKEFEFGLGTLGVTTRVAVNSTTDFIYVSDNGTGKKNVAVFGPPITLPSATTKAASNITGSKATLNGVVNPQGTSLTECKFQYGPTPSLGQTVPCRETVPADSSDHAVSADITGLVPNGATYHFRLFVNTAAGEAAPQGLPRTFVTDDTVFTEPATEIEGTTATLNGVVYPEGAQFTDCRFQYGTALDYGQSVPCNPSHSSIPDDFEAHPVTGGLGGLEPNTTYHFRLVATNALGAFVGDDRTFTTVGPPVIVEQLPLDATQTTATLQARINPAGSPTTYFFEWGPNTRYGTRVPADFNLFVGSGTEPVIVDIPLKGLQPQSAYHFRVIASNARGKTVGPDQAFETLNAAGLPDNRAYELVSPADKGAAGSVADLAVYPQLQPQPSPDGNSIAYPIQNGLPDSTSGGWVRWQGTRGDSGWQNVQLSPPSLREPASGTTRREEVFTRPSIAWHVNDDLTCTIFESREPLTEDLPTLSVEMGTTNLYRRNADGSYDLITNRVPLNSQAGYQFQQVEASDDCARVYFLSHSEYIGGASALYVWEDGTLRDAGLRPDSSVGPTLGFVFGDPAAAVSGGEVNTFGTARWNAVSPDGSRFFFTAISNAGADRGTRAVFMREVDGGGTTVTDISQSQTAVSTKNARYEAASPDGRKVFFVANHGIAGTPASGVPTNANCDGSEAFQTWPSLTQKACDLYVADADSGALAHLSVDSNPADPLGAAVQGVVAVDEDGSHVYFAALGQLVPGEGLTYAQNTTGQGSANIYLAHDGELTYVTSVSHEANGGLFGFNRAGSAILMRRPTEWKAEASADGSRLVFQSTENLTDYDTGGGKTAYLYDADAGKVSCISCPPDGAPTSDNALMPLLREFMDEKLASTWNQRPPQMSRDGSRIFFTSTNVLAPGAVPGVTSGVNGFEKANVYQWEQGQVTFLATVEKSSANGLYKYLGASADGDTVFIGSKAQLVPEDQDFVSDVYAIRADGGFPPGAGAPEPCDPLSGGSCEGRGSSAAGSADVATSSFEDPIGNVRPRPTRGRKPCSRGKRKVTRNGRARCVRKQAKKDSKRTANKTRRASR